MIQRVTWPELYKRSNTSSPVPPRRSRPGQSWDKHFLRDGGGAVKVQHFFLLHPFMGVCEGVMRQMEGRIPAGGLGIDPPGSLLFGFLRPVAAGNCKVCLLSQTLPDVWLLSGSEVM